MKNSLPSNFNRMFNRNKGDESMVIFFLEAVHTKGDYLFSIVGNLGLLSYNRVKKTCKWTPFIDFMLSYTHFFPIKKQQKKFVFNFQLKNTFLCLVCMRRKICSAWRSSSFFCCTVVWRYSLFVRWCWYLDQLWLSYGPSYPLNPDL